MAENDLDAARARRRLGRHRLRHRRHGLGRRVPARRPTTGFAARRAPAAVPPARRRARPCASRAASALGAALRDLRRRRLADAMLPPWRAFSRRRACVLLRRCCDRGVNAPRHDQRRPAVRRRRRAARACASVASFEGQAAMALEFAARPTRAGDAYPFALRRSARADGAAAACSTGRRWCARCSPTSRRGVAGRRRSPARFHNALADDDRRGRRARRRAARRADRRLLPEPLPDRAHASRACAARAFGRTGTSACRRTTAASRSARSLGGRSARRTRDKE